MPCRLLGSPGDNLPGLQPGVYGFPAKQDAPGDLEIGETVFCHKAVEGLMGTPQVLLGLLFGHQVRLVHCPKDIIHAQRKARKLFTKVLYSYI